MEHNIPMINGELIDLSSGRYQARVATCGATLVHLRRDHRDLIVPFDAENCLPSGWQGKTLIPWPNRIQGSRYTYRGTTYLVSCNEPETGAALHGLAGWADWSVSEVSDDAVVLGLTIPASYVYPWSLEATARFRLDPAGGLALSITTTCVGAAAPAVPATLTVSAPEVDGHLAPAPYSVSTHPYLTRSVPLDDCVLTSPGSQVLDVDPATMAPTHLRDVTGTDWDWRQGRLVGATTTDNAYTGLPQGTWQVRLARATGGPAVVMRADAPWVQLYTADHMGRRGVAVEPMTGAPNAFNSGQGLLTLDVGQSHTFDVALYEED